MFLPAGVDYLTGALAGLSTLYMLAATSTNPHLPYEYANPIWGFALAHYFHADFSFNRDTFFGGTDQLFGDTVSFNLGRLIGLPGPLQLLPLGLVWIVAAWRIIDGLGIWGFGLRARTSSAAVALAILSLFVPPLTAPLQQQLSVRSSHGLLARYFLGNRIGEGPPHLVRVDREVNFDNVAELGAMPFPSMVVWTGTLIAPKTGHYRFSIQVDDNGWLTIDGFDVISDPGTQAKYEATGEVDLDAGPHRIMMGERNFAGDSYARLYWEPPDGQREIVPSSALIPARYHGH